MKIPVGDIEVYLRPEGDRIVSHLIRGDKTFEPATLAAWATVCKMGGTIIDVGAYTGLFSIAAARLGCAVVAFEPLPKNADRLDKNAKRNSQRGKIRLIEAAASNHICESFINLNPHVPGLTSGASIVNEDLGRRIEKLRVAFLTIDLLNLPQVTAIKIDVERAEHLVLLGALETLKRCRPFLFVEVLDEASGEAVKAAVPDYVVSEVLDERNWLMVPKL